MKKLFFIISFFAALNANARAFYVSAAGSDANTFAQAQSSSTPWATVTKINAQLSSMSAGDSVLFRKGDVFAGVMLDVTISGIIFSNYGTGANPVISGFTDLTWTNIGGNLWESQVLTSRPYVVLIGGNYTLPSRQPNTGYFDYESSASNNSITDATLTGTWNNGEIVVRKNHSIWDKGTITQTGTTITFPAVYGDGFTDGYGYFIQNIIAACDLQNEWAYTAATNKITLFSTTTPTNCKAAQLATLFNTNGFSAHVNGIDFTGSNALAVSATHISSGGFTIKKCSFTNNGSQGLYVWDSPNSTVDSNTFNRTNEIAIQCSSSPNTNITNNTITNTGIQGQGVYNLYNAVEIVNQSTGTICEKNIVRNSGFNGIYFGFSSNVIVRKNLVDSSCLVQDDGGGIYSWLGSGNGYYTGIEISNNIVLNSIGAPQARNDFDYIPAYGIYMDDNVANVLIKSNVVSNGITSGIYIHNGSFIDIRNNLVFNNGQPSQVRFSQIYFNFDAFAVYATSFAENIIFSRSIDQFALQFDFATNTIPSSFYTLDKNFYCHPINETYQTANTYITGDPTAVSHTLAAWKIYTGKDTNSQLTERTVSTTDSIRFEYNATDVEIKIDLLGLKYVDHIGNPVNDYLYLPAYSGAVLIQVNRTSTNKLLMKQ